MALELRSIGHFTKWTDDELASRDSFRLWHPWKLVKARATPTVIFHESQYTGKQRPNWSKSTALNPAAAGIESVDAAVDPRQCWVPTDLAASLLTNSIASTSIRLGFVKLEHAVVIIK